MKPALIDLACDVINQVSANCVGKPLKCMMCAEVKLANEVPCDGRVHA